MLLGAFFAKDFQRLSSRPQQNLFAAELCHKYVVANKSLLFAIASMKKLKFMKIFLQDTFAKETSKHIFLNSILNAFLTCQLLTCNKCIYLFSNQLVNIMQIIHEVINYLLGSRFILKVRLSVAVRYLCKIINISTYLFANQLLAQCFNESVL